jgi:hypothetical protein
MTLSVANPDDTASIINALERIRKEEAVANLRQYHSICWNGLKP